RNLSRIPNKYVYIGLVIITLLLAATLIHGGYVYYESDIITSDYLPQEDEWFSIDFGKIRTGYIENDTIDLRIIFNNNKGEYFQQVNFFINNPELVTMQPYNRQGFTGANISYGPGNSFFFRNNDTGSDPGKLLSGKIFATQLTILNYNQRFIESDSHYVDLKIIPDPDVLISYGMPLHISARAALDYRAIPGEHFDIFYPNHQLYNDRNKDIFLVDHSGYSTEFITIYPDPSIAISSSAKINTAGKILWIDSEYLLAQHTSLTYEDNDGNALIDPSVPYTTFAQYVVDDRFTDLFLEIGPLDSTGSIDFADYDSTEFSDRLDVALQDIDWINIFTGFYGWIHHDLANDELSIDLSMDSTSFATTHNNIIASADYICGQDNLDLDGIVLQFDNLFENNEGLRDSLVFLNFTNLISAVKSHISPKPLILHTPPIRLDIYSQTDADGFFWSDTLFSALSDAGVDYFSMKTHDFNNESRLWYERTSNRTTALWGINSQAEYKNRITALLGELNTKLPDLQGKIIFNLIAHNNITDLHTIYETLNAGRMGILAADKNAQSMLGGVGINRFYNGTHIDFSEWLQFRELFSWTTPIPRESVSEVGQQGGVVSSADGRVQLTIEKNAVKDPFKIQIKYAPAPGDDFLTPVYNIRPAEYTFGVPANLVISYDSDNLPEGTSENGLFIAEINDSGRNILSDVQRDPENGTISSPITKLGKYAIV
ncbi:hypothetical protein ACFL6L_05090, partial [candidate division KSB1 bacterium]